MMTAGFGLKAILGHGHSPKPGDVCGSAPGMASGWRMTKSPLQLPHCSRKVVIYCGSVSAVNRCPPALNQPPIVAGSWDVPQVPPGSFPPSSCRGWKQGHCPSCPLSERRPGHGSCPCGCTELGWRSCRVREDWLGKASGLWASEGAEVEAIANVAESAHSDVAAR